MTLNKNYEAVQTDRYTLEPLLLPYCFFTFVVHFLRCYKQTSFEEQHVYAILLSLIFVTSENEIFVVGRLFH